MAAAKAAPGTIGYGHGVPHPLRGTSHGNDGIQMTICA
jgi:hypothetical protein